MPETKTLSAAATLSRLLASTQAQTEKYLKSCPENRRYFNIGEHKATPLWLAGHMANTAEFIGNFIGFGSPSGGIQDAWRKKFSPSQFGGDPVTTNPTDYPSWDEVSQAYEKVMTHLRQQVSGLTDEQLLAPPKGKIPPPLASMLSTLQDCISLNIVHDSHHRGQLALLASVAE